jgi:hypothetical protein
MESLEEAIRLQDSIDEQIRNNRDYKGSRVNLSREVRWYASVDGMSYALVNDWTTHSFDSQIDELATLRARIAELEAPPSEGEIDIAVDAYSEQVPEKDRPQYIYHEGIKAAITKFIELRK